jgi:hypothetical protein
MNDPANVSTAACTSLDGADENPNSAGREKRARLAEVVGDLLARHWLRQQEIASADDVANSSR